VGPSVDASPVRIENRFPATRVSHELAFWSLLKRPLPEACEGGRWWVPLLRTGPVDLDRGSRRTLSSVATLRRPQWAKQSGWGFDVTTAMLTGERW
jgi:hypothetical protein